MSRTAASLSPDIQRRLDTKLLNTNNNNSATLNNLSINNKTADQYDCTSIASVSESWSAGNGEDLDNMPLVLTGTDIGGIENKDWSAYIRKSNAYNSSEDDNEQGGGDDDDDEDSDLNTKTNDSNSEHTQDGFSSSNKKSSTLKPNTKLTSKNFFDEMDSNKATATGGVIDSGLKKKKKKIDKIGNNGGTIHANSKNNNNNGGVIDDDDIDNSLNDNDSDEIDDIDDDVEDEDEDEDDDDDDDYEDDGDNNEDNENDLDDDDIWTIKPKLLKYYEKQFKSMQSDLNGLISGLEAKQFFEKSKLPLNELSKIWELSDVNRDGALSFSEFCTAMHLVVLRVRNFELPDQLPAKLQPYAPLIDFESDATAGTATGAVNQTSSSSSSILNDKIINKQLNNQHLTQLSPISTNSPISFIVNPQIQTDQTIVHPVPLRIQQQHQQQTPFAEMAKLRSPVATSAVAPRPQPPPRHSRSSSLGAIINKVQPPAIPPRENDANNANIPQHTMLPPPPPPPPLPPPPPAIASPATILPNTSAAVVVTTISPPPPSTLATQFLNQKTIENIVEQVHNINLDQMRRLQEENQLTENLFEKLKQSKENNYKLRKYYIDLEKELRNLTDTRIALEIKYESLIAVTSALTAPLPQSTSITTTPQLNNNTNSNSNNSNVNINNANLATTKFI